MYIFFNKNDAHKLIVYNECLFLKNNVIFSLKYEKYSSVLKLCSYYNDFAEKHFFCRFQKQT